MVEMRPTYLILSLKIGLPFLYLKKWKACEMPTKKPHWYLQQQDPVELVAPICMSAFLAKINGFDLCASFAVIGA